MLQDIHLVNEPTIVHLGSNHIGIFRCDTLYAWYRTLLSIIGGIAFPPRREQDRCHHIQLWDTLAQAINILLVHGPPATLAETLIGLRRLLRPYHDRIRGKALKVTLQHLLQSLPATYQGDEHEDTPEHTETCEEGT